MTSTKKVVVNGRERRRALQGLVKAYGEQLDDIGRMLVQAGILTAREVRRQGVRFALRDRLGAGNERGDDY